MRSKLPIPLGLLILVAAAFLRLQGLSTEFDKIRTSSDASQALLDELDAVRPKLPQRGRISLLLQGEEQAHDLRPLIDSLAKSIAEHFKNGELPADPAQAALVKTYADGLRPGFPGLAQHSFPSQAEIADLLEKVHFATLDAAAHTLAQYALVPLIIDPVLRPGLVLAKLPKGKARAEAIRLGLRWKKPVGKGWYLLEKRP